MAPAGVRGRSVGLGAGCSVTSGRPGQAHGLLATRAGFRTQGIYARTRRFLGFYILLCDVKRVRYSLKTLLFPQPARKHGCRHHEQALDPVMCGVDFGVSQKVQTLLFIFTTYVRHGKATTLTSKEWNKSALFCNLS
jgi:hypothetical protein